SYNNQRSGVQRCLHSFPTRRSSDLGRIFCSQLEQQVFAVSANGFRTEEDPVGDLRIGITVGYQLQQFPLAVAEPHGQIRLLFQQDRKSTRLNSSHVKISYAVFCLKK